MSEMTEREMDRDIIQPWSGNITIYWKEKSQRKYVEVGLFFSPFKTSAENSVTATVVL